MHRTSEDDKLKLQLHTAAQMLQSGAGTEALELLGRLAAAHSSNADVLHMYGVVLSQADCDIESLAILRRRLVLIPGSLPAAADLANVLLKTGQFDQALNVLTNALELSSQDVEAQEAHAFNFNLGRALKSSGRAHDAVLPLRRVLRWQAGHYGALISLGDVYKALGQDKEAAQCFRDAIAAQPADGTAWWSLSNLKASAFTSSEKQHLARCAEKAVSQEQKVYFEFAMATAFEQDGQAGQAFEHYRRGNLIKHQLEPWNRRHFSEWLESVRQAMDKVAIARRATDWSGPRPVFLVSLPRSGSTLTEQVLAAHSQVTAASELPWIPRILADESGNRNGSLADWASELTAGEWQAMGQRYLEYCQPWYLNSAVFTDKLPGNIPFVGAILAMLPNALVINVRRDAMDVSWSCYRQLFLGGAAFTNEFQDLASYWRDHQQHMRYWEQRCPDRIMSIDYEKLVQQPELETRRMLEFVDLPFEPACLSPHMAQRAVNTASASQVREQIHTRGIGHWRTYEPWLGELADAFDLAKQDNAAH